MDAALETQLRKIYEDLHAHPELSNEETRTAAIAADWLRVRDYEVIEQVGGTGVVGVLRNGEGPIVLLRADMDALPVTEATGLPYASTVAGVMHACGHDLHVTCLLGAAQVLATTREEWAGTLVLVFQPSEEVGSGAQGMVDDGLFTRAPRPDVVLGQHVVPLPPGIIGVTPGAAFAATDSMRVTMFGTGGHGSRPEATVDPVLMAAATVQRLQGIVAREVPAQDTAVLTVGALNAGTKSNIIPDRAELLLNVRTFVPAVRERVLAAIKRIVIAEAEASGAPLPPTFELFDDAPAVVNDVEGAARTRTALEAVVGPGYVIDPGPLTGSEDVGLLAEAAGVPIVYWLLGGADPASFAGATCTEDLVRMMEDVPSNHSPFFAPLPDPTIALGVAALTAGARAWLA